MTYLHIPHTYVKLTSYLPLCADVVWFGGRGDCFFLVGEEGEGVVCHGLKDNISVTVVEVMGCACRLIGTAKWLRSMEVYLWVALITLWFPESKIF